MIDLNKYKQTKKEFDFELKKKYTLLYKLNTSIRYIV